MEKLESESACIALAKLGIEQYPHIKNMLLPGDYTRWESKLKAEESRKYIFGSTGIFNLLTTSVITGMGLRQDLQDRISQHASRLLAKLDLYLASFPSLEKDLSFKQKVGNLEGFCFLSTLSELSLAHHFKQMGLNITFERMFTNLSVNRRKDIDITVIDKKGIQVHLEVYMPNSQADIDGFFDSADGDHHYSYKVAQKLSDKFGQQGLTGLSGLVLLAVNIGFMDMLRIKKTILRRPTKGPDSDIMSKLPPGIHGLLLFCDIFGTMDSISLESLYIK
ncbi:MAG TPA: hypothetical protein VE035_14660 [Puia sp.]|nr:hypothetical protein [Puia sp.]